MTVISTCSLMLNGPGFIVHLFPKLIIVSFGSVRARNTPIGYESKVARNEGMLNVFVLNENILLTAPSDIHQTLPSNIARNDKDGARTSSVVGTIPSRLDKVEITVNQYRPSLVLVLNL